MSQQYPDEAARRRWLGQFDYRPPGGESWADVALRLRSLLADLDRDEPGRRVLVVAHDAVVLLVRYICERLAEEALIAIARSATIGDCSVTRLVRPDAGRRGLLTFDEQGHLDEVGPGTGSERAVEPSSRNHLLPRAVLTRGAAPTTRSRCRSGHYARTVPGR